MKVAILTNYPLFDNAGWKVKVAMDLQSMGVDVSVYYGKIGLWRQLISVYKKLQGNKAAVSAVKGRSGKRFRSNLAAFIKLGVPVYKMDNLNTATAARKVSENGVDFCICALDQILSAEIVSTYPKLLNVHYGCLPDIKGASAAEWTLVEQGELKITLHEIDAGVDTGSILGIFPIDLSGVSDLGQVRNRIQAYIPGIISSYCRGGKKHLGLDNSHGHLYTFMHRDLVKILEKSLKNEADIES